jgi:hypothetical protein
VPQVEPTEAPDASSREDRTIFLAWLGEIERDVITRRVFTSVADLKREPVRYIREYNKAPRK